MIIGAVIVVIPVWLASRAMKSAAQQQLHSRIVADASTAFAEVVRDGSIQLSYGGRYCIPRARRPIPKSNT